MSMPQPPEDEGLKNIIEKLAQFVAKNGTDFEDMTKNKQKDNPKFQFLFGGAFYDYYQYHLASAKASMEQQQQMEVPPWQQQNQFQPNQQVPPWQQQQQQTFHQPQRYNQQPQYDNNFQAQQQQHSGPQPLMANPQNPTGFVKEQSDLEEEEKRVKEQVAESEKNLKQQHAALMVKQEEQIEAEIMEKEEGERLQKASYCDLDLTYLDNVLGPIMDSCTKDLIGNGKTWILANSSKEENCVLISEQLLSQVMKTAKNVKKKGGDKKKVFTVHLHSLYLINDVLHHAKRKNLDQLVNAIGDIIVPLFCLAKSVAENDKEQEKLQKLLSLWTKYFENETFQKFENHTAALKEFNQQKFSKHTEIVNRISNETQKNYRDFEKQHQEYADHIANLLKEKQQDLEMRTNAHRIQQEANNNSSSWNLQEGQQREKRRPSRFDKGPNEVENRPFINQHHQQSYPPQPNFPPQGGPPRMPGPPQIVKPDRPYFDLPAGLMAPLVRLDEMDYKELDPNMIRLPMPMPPNDRLRAAVDAFYAPPSHDRPRNADGWEANGLFEFFKAKMQAKKDLESKNNIIQQHNRPQRRNMRSRFSSTSPHSTGRRSRSSSSHSRSRSRSRSYSRSRSTSRSRSRSSSRSRSYSRSPKRNVGENNMGIDRTSPDRHVNLNKNAPTPPRLIGNSGQSSLDAATAFQQKLVQMAQQSEPTEAPPGKFAGMGQNRRLGGNNVGAMMMAKMGWGGAGLGAKEQGRQDIIKAGEVRDNYDKFKGLGNEVNNPYDEFRKNRSKGYINRIRSRRHSPRRK